MYECHIFELRKYELDRKKIIAVINTTYAVVKRKPEKIRPVRDSNPKIYDLFFLSNSYFRSSNI